MLCFIEPLGLPAGMLRPGGATANNGADQLAVIDQAIALLPAEWQAGHHDGDDPDQIARRLVVRADTAGGTSKVTKGLADRNIVFSVGMGTSEVAAAIIADIDGGCRLVRVRGEQAKYAHAFRFRTCEVEGSTPTAATTLQNRIVSMRWPLSRVCVIPNLPLTAMSRVLVGTDSARVAGRVYLRGRVRRQGRVRGVSATRIGGYEKA